MTTAINKTLPWTLLRGHASIHLTGAAASLGALSLESAVSDLNITSGDPGSQTFFRHPWTSCAPALLNNIGDIDLMFRQLGIPVALTDALNIYSLKNQYRLEWDKFWARVQIHNTTNFPVLVRAYWVKYRNPLTSFFPAIPGQTAGTANMSFSAFWNTTAASVGLSLANNPFCSPFENPEFTAAVKILRSTSHSLKPGEWKSYFNKPFIKMGKVYKSGSFLSAGQFSKHSNGILFFFAGAASHDAANNNNVDTSPWAVDILYDGVQKCRMLPNPYTVTTSVFLDNAINPENAVRNPANFNNPVEWQQNPGP